MSRYFRAFYASSPFPFPLELLLKRLTRARRNSPNCSIRVLRNGLRRLYFSCSINARAQRKTSRNPVSGSQNPGGFIAYENEWVVMQQGSTTSLESVSAVKCTIGWRVRYLSGPGWGERKFRFPPAAFPLKA